MSTWDRIAYQPLFSPKALILIGVNLTDLPCASISIELAGPPIERTFLFQPTAGSEFDRLPGKISKRFRGR